MAEPKLHAVDIGQERAVEEEHPKGWKPVGQRKHPREVWPGDPMYREYTWSGLPAFECRYPTKFHAATERGKPTKTWTLACCKTFFSKVAMAEHMAEEHNIDPPSELEGD